MTWEIVTGLIALVGAAVTVGTLSARLSGILARLDASVKELSAAAAALRAENREDHASIRQALERHEGRIAKLEEICRRA